MLTLFITLASSTTITLGVLENMKLWFTPFAAPVGTMTEMEAPPVTATFAVPPPPFVTVAPEVKLIVETLTTGVIPSVTVRAVPLPLPPGWKISKK